MVFKLFTLVVFLFAHSQLTAQTGFKAKSLVFFKNGMGFVTKSGIVAPQNGEFVWRGTFPQALYGTFWFIAEGNTLTSIRSSSDSIKKMATAQTHADLLMANIKKTVTVTVSYNAQHTDVFFGLIDTVTNMSNGKGILQLALNPKGFRLVSIEFIKELMFETQPKYELSRAEVENTIHIGFKNPAKEQPLDVMYLQNGLGWTPEYLIEMTDKKNARITLRGICQNETNEHFENTDCYFAIGVPNFKFATKPTSLVLSAAMENYLRQSTNADGVRLFANYQVPNMNTSNQFGSDAVNNSSDNSADGEQQQDLFFYVIKNVSIKKGERIAFDLMTMTVPIEHLYRIQMNKNDRETPLASVNDVGFENRKTATHVIKFPNNSDKPLTTASALLVNAEKQPIQALSQDLLRYVPAKGKGDLVVTTTPDVLAEESYVELTRKAKAHEFRGYFYDAIRVKGKIAVRNYKKEAITMAVYKTIEGIMDKTNVAWEMTNTKDAKSYPNSINNITWKVDLKVGEEKIIEFEYDVLVRWGY